MQMQIEAQKNDRKDWKLDLVISLPCGINI
jgi:hypothetical protein